MQQTVSDNVILELTVRNHPGVMTHVCGLFARRAFNVEGILCLPIKDSEHSRIWLLVNDDQRLEQMISQIESWKTWCRSYAISRRRGCSTNWRSSSSKVKTGRLAGLFVF
jgi:acetolactate synthase-1/3 small subunit